MVKWNIHGYYHFRLVIAKHGYFIKEGFLSEMMILNYTWQENTKVGLSLKCINVKICMIFGRSIKSSSRDMIYHVPTKKKHYILIKNQYILSLQKQIIIS